MLSADVVIGALRVKTLEFGCNLPHFTPSHLLHLFVEIFILV